MDGVPRVAQVSVDVVAWDEEDLNRLVVDVTLVTIGFKLIGPVDAVHTPLRIFLNLFPGFLRGASLRWEFVPIVFCTFSMRKNPLFFNAVFIYVLTDNVLKAPEVVNAVPR